MKELLRFDTLVASIALLMSTITAAAMVYQTRVLQDQFAATVWPYLSVNRYYGPHNLEIHVENQGVGPALIRSAQVVVDGKPMAGWSNQFFRTVFGSNLLSGKDPLTVESVDASTAIRAGDDVTLFKAAIRNAALVVRAQKHDIALRFCYCSINQRCWTLDSSSRSSKPTIPVVVSSCTTQYAISASR